MGEILFLAHRVPFPPNRGDKIRSHHLLAKLANMGRVHIGCFAENAEDHAAISQVEQISASHCVVNRSKPLVLAGAQAVLTGKPVSLTAFHSAQLQEWVQQTIAERPISAIVIFSGQMGQYVPDSFTGRIIIDLCDVDSAKFESYAKAGERVWLNQREGRLLAVEEERLANRSDATILISDAEAALFMSRLSGASLPNVQVIGNGIDATMFDPDRVNAHAELSGMAGLQFVFTGQMDYRPNEAAALWVIENFLPLIRQKFPKTMFHVVGRNPTPSLMKHSQQPGLRIWGEVPDVRPLIAAADCVLAPLLIARGVQNKVLEAMAMAKPVLLTPDAATGINAKDGDEWMVSSADAQAMCERIESLISTPDKAERMGQAARRFVLDHHAWDAMLAPLDAMLSGKATSREDRNVA